MKEKRIKERRGPDRRGIPKPTMLEHRSGMDRRITLFNRRVYQERGYYAK